MCVESVTTCGFVCALCCQVASTMWHISAVAMWNSGYAAREKEEAVFIPKGTDRKGSV